MAYKVALDESELLDFQHLASERGTTASATANDLIKDALERNLPPKLKAISTTNKMPTFQLRSSLLGRTKKHLKQNKYSFDKDTSQTLTGLIRSSLYQHDDDIDDGRGEVFEYATQFFSRVGMVPREMQLELTDRLIRQQKSGMVSLHEASTGIGKTAAKLCAASYLIDTQSVTSVLIAVPTNKLIEQTISQGKRFGLEVKKLKARSDFISDTAIDIALDDYPEHAKALQFIQDEVLKTGCHEIALLCDDVKEAVAKFPFPVGCDHNTPKGDAGIAAYEQSYSNFHPNGIMLATHAMLARELHRLVYGSSNAIAQYGERFSSKLGYDLYTKVERKKANVGAIAPKYDEWLCDELEEASKDKLFELTGLHLPFSLGNREKMSLFIDEAHLYPAQIELALSSSVSIDLLIKRLSSPPNISGRRRAFLGAAEHLKQLRNVDMSHSGDIKGVLEQALDDLKRVSSASVAGLDAKSQLRFNRIKSAVNHLIDFATSPFECSLRRSHRREKLSLHSLSSFILQLVLLQATHRFCHSISYMSATLNDHSGDYRLIRSGLRLNSPKVSERLEKNESLIAPWLYQDVQFKVYDGCKSNEDYEWKAERIFEEWLDIKGGTLVLCNSYVEIEDTAARLRQLSPTPKVICDQSGVKSNNASEFLKSYRNGEKPIYLATGAAWTGLDMTDSEVPASEDNLIQLLVVTKAPFSYQPAGRSDFQNYSFAKRSSEALIKLKQGFGRLVRREGREGMRILYLDAKYRSPHRTIFKRYIERMYKV